MTDDTKDDGTIPSAGSGQNEPGLQPPDRGGISFRLEDLSSKSERTEETGAAKDEPELPQLYTVGTFERSASAPLQQLRTAGGDRDLQFWRQLRAIAAAADGLGLGPPDRVVALVQRDVDFASLAVLAEELEADPKAPLHTVTLSAESTTEHSPERLAAELADRKLEGAVILLVLPSWAITSAWADICRESTETPLRQFLEETGKRLIIGMEPSPQRPMSHLVNSETGLSPLPWGLPLLAKLAAQNNFRAAHFDHALVRRLDAESAWGSFLDDGHERGRSVQFAGIETTYREPGELTGRLQMLLSETDVSLESLWKLSKARANDAIGLGRDPTLLGEETKAPAAIKRGLLCSAAFATGLPSGRFLAIVRASLPEGRTVGLSDITKEEHDEVMLLAGLQGSEHKTLPPMESLRDYFDRHADRICQAYGIETDPEGHMGLAASWRAFPLASHICATAPSMAIEYTRQLLSGAGDIGDLATGDINPLVRIIATLQCHLSSGVSRRQLAAWLLECAVQPIAREHQRALEEDMTDEILAERKARRLSLEEMAVVAGAVAHTIIEFLTELRKAAASAGRQLSIRQETAHLRQAVLDRIVNWRLAVMLALFMILMDKDAEPGEHDALEALLQKTITERGEMDFVVATISFHFRDHRAGDAEARCVGACSVLEFFDRAAAKPNGHPAWRTARNRVLSMLLNYDIRWPPANGGLLAYEKHRPRVALDLVVHGEAESGGPAIVRDGNRIIAEGFFAQGASSWLAGSWQNWAAVEAPQRLYDIVLVLLDGPPATTRYWKTRAYEQTADKVLNTLLFECGASGLASLADYAERLADCPDYVDPPRRSRPYVQLYGLFWPALLLFWRFRLFGVEPLDPADPSATHFKAFLARICRTASPGTVADMADGMKRLVVALDRAVLAAMIRQSDPAAYDFYTHKREAAAKLERFLRKRVPAEKPQGDRRLIGNRTN